MSDYDKYLAALSQDAGDNLYSGIGGVADQLSLGALDYVKQPGADIGESLLYGSILGLLGGSLGQLGANQAAEETSLASRVLTGEMTERPEGLPENLYRKATTYRDMVAASRMQEEALKNSDALRDIRTEARKGILAGDPRVRDEVALGDFSRFAGKEVADSDMEEKGRPETEEDSFVQSPLVKRARDLYDQGLFKTVPDALSGLQEESRKLRSEYQPLVDNYKKSLIGFRSLVGAYQDPHSTSDLELIRGAIQAIEPGLSVKEGEAASVEGSTSLFGKYAAAVSKAMTGESGLDADARAGIMRIAQRRLDSFADALESDKDFYMQKFKLLGVPAGEAMPGGDLPIVRSDELLKGVDIGSKAPTGGSSLVPSTSLEQQALDFVAQARARGASDAEIRSGWQAYKAHAQINGM